MLLVAIVVLLGLALWLVRSILRPEPVQPPPEQSGTIVPWHSDYKQLRVEYHQFVDKSVPPKQ